MMNSVLKGERYELDREQHPLYPQTLKDLSDPPEKLYVIGDINALSNEGLAIIGARKASDYGKRHTDIFAKIAASYDIPIVSGGARGLDTAAHVTALSTDTPTIAVLGGGLDHLYPPENHQLFQQIVEKGGALVSEQPWNELPHPYMFRMRNRLIAALSKAVLITEAAIPSGTFVTVEYAKVLNREVLCIPGSIDNPHCAGSNRLLYEGSKPIINEQTFIKEIRRIFSINDLEKQNTLTFEELCKSAQFASYEKVHSKNLEGQRQFRKGTR